ncbi:polyhydroxyalkanoate biosynthesis repressor PhaR [Neobacillus sp. NRS-1170]|uniref:polyhydroxyalkanoate biosynthesis repressor PhaR n=1 Tax=Neobacillus sp. NRS-1170 TaxID=3233898 RepID=UPI003D276A27
MTNRKTIDPFNMVNKVYGQWENQMNDLIHLWTNNREFVRLSRTCTDTSSFYKDVINKGQELVGNQLNLPTKEDVANIAKLSIQTEEKLDSLEEQIWNLQDNVSSTNKEIEGVAQVSSDIMKLTKQLKTELTKTKSELYETKKLNSELQLMKNELAGLQSLKEELTELTTLLQFMNVRTMETTAEQNHEPAETISK